MEGRILPWTLTLKSEYGSSLKEEISYYFFYIEKKKVAVALQVTSFNLKRLHSWCSRPQKAMFYFYFYYYYYYYYYIIIILYYFIIILLYLYSLKSI